MSRGIAIFLVSTVRWGGGGCFEVYPGALGDVLFVAVFCWESGGGLEVLVIFCDVGCATMRRKLELLPMDILLQGLAVTAGGSHLHVRPR